MRLLQALAGENTGRPPVWMMRQAGRYLPEYRSIRAKHSFLEMIYTPELVATITLQPVQRYNVDAAILFSDILVTGSALNCPVDFIDNQGPVFKTPIRAQAAVDALDSRAAQRIITPITEAIKLLRNDITVPLIGFAGAPFTVASYMIEGRSSSTLSLVKRMSYEAPAILTSLLDKLTDITIVYLKAQVDAGIQVIQLFDTWANYLTINQFKKYSLVYIQKIITALRAYTDVPIITFSKNTGILWPHLVSLQPDAISIDWGCSITAMRQVIPQTISLQGNIDPFLLYAPQAVIKSETQAMLDSLAGPNYIMNLGHGITPETPLDNVAVFIETVQTYTKAR